MRRNPARHSQEQRSLVIMLCRIVLQCDDVSPEMERWPPPQLRTTQPRCCSATPRPPAARGHMMKRLGSFTQPHPPSHTPGPNTGERRDDRIQTGTRTSGHHRRTIRPDSGCMAAGPRATPARRRQRTVAHAGPPRRVDLAIAPLQPSTHVKRPKQRGKNLVLLHSDACALRAPHLFTVAFCFSWRSNRFSSAVRDCFTLDRWVLRNTSTYYILNHF